MMNGLKNANMEINDIKDFIKRSNSLETVYDDFDFEAVLNKYGPEGCYQIAEKLIKLADEDIRNALSENYKD